MAEVPAVAEPILKPSIKIIECVELVPRMFTDEVLPGPPLLETSIPGCCCSS